MAPRPSTSTSPLARPACGGGGHTCGPCHCRSRLPIPVAWLAGKAARCLVLVPTDHLASWGSGRRHLMGHACQAFSVRRWPVTTAPPRPSRRGYTPTPRPLGSRTRARRLDPCARTFHGASKGVVKQRRIPPGGYGLGRKKPSRSNVYAVRTSRMPDHSWSCVSPTLLRLATSNSRAGVTIDQGVRNVVRACWEAVRSGPPFRSPAYMLRGLVDASRAPARSVR